MIEQNQEAFPKEISEFFIFGHEKSRLSEQLLFGRTKTQEKVCQARQSQLSTDLARQSQLPTDFEPKKEVAQPSQLPAPRSP